MEIKSKGTQAFNVPLDDEDKSFIQYCRKYAHNTKVERLNRRCLALEMEHTLHLLNIRKLEDERHKLVARNYELASECDNLLKQLKATPTKQSTPRFNSEKFLLRQVLVKCHDGHVWYAGLKVQFPNDLRQEGAVFKCDLCLACDSLGKLKFYRVVLGTIWKQEVETTKVWKYAN